jgi:hypothetical protein
MPKAFEGMEDFKELASARVKYINMEEGNLLAPSI